MKKTCLFAGVSAHALLGGALLAILLATGLISETQAIGLSNEAHSAQLSSSEPSCEKSMPIADEISKQLIPGGDNRVIRIVGTCNAVNVAQPNEWNCTAGTACAEEDQICGQGKTCKTLKNEGTCFCSCKPRVSGP